MKAKAIPRSYVLAPDFDGNTAGGIYNAVDRTRDGHINIIFDEDMYVMQSTGIQQRMQAVMDRSMHRIINDVTLAVITNDVNIILQELNSRGEIYTAMARDQLTFPEDTVWVELEGSPRAILRAEGMIQ